MSYKHNASEAGELHDIVMSWQRIYIIDTKKGNYRGWKSYSEEKFFVVLTGEVELHTTTWWNEKKDICTPGEIHHIPANTPNLFYFPKDSQIVEWFNKEATAEKYKPYYDVKNKSIA